MIPEAAADFEERAGHPELAALWRKQAAADRERWPERRKAWDPSYVPNLSEALRPSWGRNRTRPKKWWLG